jgi:hypothetical protein
MEIWHGIAILGIVLVLGFVFAETDEERNARLEAEEEATGIRVIETNVFGKRKRRPVMYANSQAYVQVCNNYLRIKKAKAESAPQLSESAAVQPRSPSFGGIAAGYVTNSTLIGGLISGDILGAAIGDSLKKDD